MPGHISDAAVPDNTLLVAGQRRFDSTEIVNWHVLPRHPPSRGGSRHLRPLSSHLRSLSRIRSDRYHTLLAGRRRSAHASDRHHRG